MKETAAQYYARREQEELSLARMATTQAARDAHRILAIKYAAISEAAAGFDADSRCIRPETGGYQFSLRSNGDSLDDGQGDSASADRGRAAP